MVAKKPKTYGTDAGNMAGDIAQGRWNTSLEAWSPWSKRLGMVQGGTEKLPSQIDTNPPNKRKWENEL